MSNAPRPSKSVQKYLLSLKMNEIFVKKVFTSGEAALEILKKNIYGKKFYHLGPERDKDLLVGFETSGSSNNRLEIMGEGEVSGSRNNKLERRARWALEVAVIID